jgi:hypothetical protein
MKGGKTAPELLPRQEGGVPFLRGRESGGLFDDPARHVVRLHIPNCLIAEGAFGYA